MAEKIQNSKLLMLLLLIGAVYFFSKSYHTVDGAGADRYAFCDNFRAFFAEAAEKT